MLTYSSTDLTMTGYNDSDFQADKDSRKSTSGSVFILNGGAVVWWSIKQSCIDDSTMEAEYVAACEVLSQFFGQRFRSPEWLDPRPDQVVSLRLERVGLGIPSRPLAVNVP